MDFHLLAETAKDGTGLMVGSNVATFLGGMIISRIWPRRSNGNGRGNGNGNGSYVTKEFYAERHRNLEAAIGRVEHKVDHLIEQKDKP